MSEIWDRFASLFSDHCDDVYAYAVRRVGPDEAEDVVAETFTVVWRQLEQVPQPTLPWLYGVARNIVAHVRRSRARRARLLSRIQQQRVVADTEHQRIEIDAVLNQLDPTDAEVLRLTVWEQLTPSEIAQALDISAGSARQRLLRARTRAQHLFCEGSGDND